MKTIKSWVGYGIYLLFLTVYIIVCFQVKARLFDQQQKTHNLTSFVLWNIIVFTLFGMILGLDYIFKEFKKEGSWKINWSKLILLGLPSAYLTLCLLALVYNFDFIVPQFIYNLLMPNLFITEAIDVLLGNTIISSFYKVKTDNRISV